MNIFLKHEDRFSRNKAYIVQEQIECVFYDN